MVNKLQIVRVDNVSVQRVDLQIGNNIIGRGAATGHVDNPIVENAVTINLAPNGEMTMTPMQTCYIKTGSSSRWQSLKVDCAVPIRSGDICSLLPEKSWFKIISNDSVTMEDKDTNGKRKATNPSEEEPPDKKLRSEGSMETIYSQSKSVLDNWDSEGVAAEEGDNGTSSNCPESNDISDDPSGNNNSVSGANGNTSIEVISIDNDDATPENIVAVTPVVTLPPSEEDRNNSSANIPENGPSSSRNRDETRKKIKWDCGRHFSDQTDQKTSEAAEEIGEASGSTEKTPEAGLGIGSTLDDLPRNKCAYGSQCYRRNSSHRAQFSHPGDEDYDKPDDRPECPYGIRCYRKNPQHRQDFKHTKVRRTRAQTPVRGERPNAASGTEQSSAEESVDESDYELSLATSDDYESETDYDKSDYDGVSDVDANDDI